MLNETLVVDVIKRSLYSLKDQCYKASEAFYHIYGKEHGYVPVRGGGHWWLRRPDGTVLDITAAQYPKGFDYTVGRGGGFLTKKPSKRTQELLDWIEPLLNPWRDFKGNEHA